MKTIASIFYLFVLISAVASPANASVKLDIKSTTGIITLSNDIARDFFNFLPIAVSDQFNCLKSTPGNTNTAPACIKFGDQVVKSVKVTRGIQCEIDRIKKTSKCKIHSQDKQLSNLVAGEPALVIANTAEFGPIVGNNVVFNYRDSFKFSCIEEVSGSSTQCFTEVEVGARDVEVSLTSPYLTFSGDRLLNNRHTINAYRSSGLVKRAEVLYESLKPQFRDLRPKFDGFDPALFVNFRENLGFTISIYNLQGTIVDKGQRDNQGFIEVELSASTVNEIVDSIESSALNILTDKTSLFGMKIQNRYKIEFSSDLNEGTLTLYY